MATILWRGDSVAVAQVDTFTVGGTAANGQIYTVTINGKAVTYTATVSDTNATIAAALQANLAASTIAEFQEATWTVNSLVITATANTPGIPFAATSSATGTGTLVHATTAGQGPNDLGVAANYSTGSLPTAGDDLYFQNSTSPALYNLTALSGVGTLNTLNFDSTYAAAAGLPRYNANGNYLEYRPRYLKVAATTVNIGTSMGTSPGGGSGLLQIDGNAVASTINVMSTGSPAAQGQPAVILQNYPTTSVLNIQQGQVGVAIEPGATTTLTTTNIGSQQSPATDVTLVFGSGVTPTTVNQYGGNLTVNSSMTTHTMYGGTATVLGSAAITTANVQSGTLYHESSGTITTLKIGEAGTADFSRDPRLRTVTNCTLGKGATLNDPNKTVTFTNPFYLQYCGLGDVNLSLGLDFHLARS